MRFEPTPIEDLVKQTRKLLPDGIYPAEITKAEERLSKNGNEMVVIDVQIYSDDWSYIIKDYLMVNMPSLKLKVFKCMEALGMDKQYKNGVLDTNELIGKLCYAEIYTEGEENSQYGPQNRIRKYISVEDQEAAEQDKPVITSTQKTLHEDAVVDDIDDEVPF